MKLYGLYTPTHEALLREWFLPSLRDAFDLQLERHEQVGTPDKHHYGTAEFNRTTQRKVEITLQAIEDNWDDCFVVSDVDIQFFGPAEDRLRHAIQHRDIVFQQNQANGEINAGFFVCRANARTRTLWLKVREVLREKPDWNDQDALNHLMFRALPPFIGQMPQSHRAQHCLAAAAEWGLPTHLIAQVLPLFRNPFELRWSYLPAVFFLKGLNSRGNWQPGQKLRIPGNVVVHHANFCIGVDEKVAQLRAVSAIVANRQDESPNVEQPLG